MKFPDSNSFLNMYVMHLTLNISQTEYVYSSPNVLQPHIFSILNMASVYGFSRQKLSDHSQFFSVHFPIFHSLPVDVKATVKYRYYVYLLWAHLYSDLFFILYLPCSTICSQAPMSSGFCCVSHGRHWQYIREQEEKKKTDYFFLYSTWAVLYSVAPTAKWVTLDQKLQWWHLLTWSHQLKRVKVSSCCLNSRLLNPLSSSQLFLTWLVTPEIKLSLFSSILNKMFSCF